MVRWVICLLLGAALALIGAVSVAAGAGDSNRREGAEFPQDRAALDAYERAQAEQRQREAFRESSRGRAERDASRDAYKHQSDAEALATARSEFPALVEAPPLRWPLLRDGQRVERYLGTQAALVTGPGGKGSLLESNVPLRARTPSGSEAPIDLALTDQGATYAPKSTLGPVRIPKRSTGDLRFPDHGFGIKLGGAEAGDGSVTSNKVFFANALTDTDLVMEPNLLGAEISLVLRSPASPSSAALRFDLAPGQNLRLASAADDNPLPVGSAEIVKGNDRIASISPASAVDAQGKPIDVGYRVEGDALVMDVQHGGDVAYPVRVDPTTTLYDPNGQGVCLPGEPHPCPDANGQVPPGYYWPGWSTATTRQNSCPAKPAPNPGPTHFSSCKPADGELSITAYRALAAGLQPYVLFDMAYWLKPARSGTYIWRLDANNMSHLISNPSKSAMFGGVCSTGCGSWEWGHWFVSGGTPRGGNQALHQHPEAVASMTEYYCVDPRNGPKPADGGPPTGENLAAQDHCWQGATADDLNGQSLHENNQARWGMFMLGGMPNVNVLSVMGAAATLTADNVSPDVVSTSHTNAPGIWADSYSDTVTMRAADNHARVNNQYTFASDTNVSGDHLTGVGLGNVSVSAIKPLGQAVAVGTKDAGCETKRSYDNCPQVLTFPGISYSAPDEGITTYGSTTSDVIGNDNQGQTWSAKVDRTAPVFSPAPSGALSTRSGWTKDPSPALTVSVKDNGPNGVATAGAQKSTIEFDRPSGPSYSLTNKKSDGTTMCDTTSGCGSTLNQTVAPTLADGAHTVNIGAQDPIPGANHQAAPDSWTVRLDRTQPSINSLSGSGYAPPGWLSEGQRTVVADVADSHSGVRKVELLVDGAVADTKSPSCTGGCPNTYQATFNWTPSSEGTKTLQVRVTDAADATSTPGNQRLSSSWTVKVDTAAPVFGTASGPMSGSGWISDPTVTIPVADSASGVQSNTIQLTPNGASNTATNKKGDGTTCDAQSGCATSLTHTWTASVADGRYTLTSTAQDPVNHQKSTGWPVKIDRVDPSATAPTGSLYLPSRWIKDGAKAVHVDATDATSGVQRVELRVDNTVVDTKTGTCSPNCPTSLPADLTWTPSTSTTEGAHAIKIIVYDEAGRSYSVAWTIYLDKFNPTFGAPNGSLAKPTGWVTDPNPSLTVNASDTGSGVARDTIKVDSPNGPSNVKTNKKTDGTTDCDDTSGCANSLSHTWAPTISDGTHQVDVTALDAVGRSVNDSWSVKLDRSAPVVDQNETGSLANKGGWVKDGDLAVNATATDATSGVAKLELFVDGVLKDSKTQTCGSTCGSSFSATLRWNSTGSTNATPQIRVKATDLAGNKPAGDFSAPATDSWTVKIDRTNPSATVTGDLKQPNQVLSHRPYHLTVAAVDGTPTAPSSGVARIELAVDGHTRDSCDQTVAGDNAPLTCVFTFDPATADEGKRTIEALVKDRAGNVYVEQWFVIFDHTDPVLGSPTHTNLPSGWVDSATPTVKLDATDGQSGVKRIDLYTPSSLNAAVDDTQTWDAGCTGTVPDPCPQSASHTFSYGSTLPEGDNRIHAHAEDAATPAHISTPDRDWHVKVDRTPPELQLSGSLTTLGSAPIVAGAYDLQMDATDGNRSSPANERSGVKSLEVQVRRTDPEPVEAFRQVYFDDQDCAAGSCGMSRTWVFRREAYKPGTYEVRVNATDQIGHVTTQTRTIRLGPDVLEPRHAMGLEEFWQYKSVDTGGGTAAHVNLATGNMVWHSTPVVNPGRGLSTVANVTYNSQQLTKDALLDYNQIGEGFSLGIAGLTRVNEPLDVSLAPIHGPIFLTDVDGTRHTFQPSGDGTWYIHPPGFDIFLRRFATSVLPNGLGLLNPEKAWAATRPDGVTFYFDFAGYPTSIEDRNGNRLRFDYEYLSVVIPNQPCAIVAPLVGTPLASDVCRRRLDRVVDASGVDNDPKPYESGEAGENATFRDQRSVHVCYKPDIVEQLTGVPGTGPIKRLKDHAGRVTEFEYDDHRYLTAMTQAKQAGGDESNEGDCAQTGASGQQAAERTFRFDYEPWDPVADPASLVAKRYMLSVKDPRDNTTTFTYQDRLDALEDQVNTDPQGLTAFQRRRLLSLRDRESHTTEFGYSEDVPLGGPPSYGASVTDPRGNSSSYKMDSRARPVDILSPQGAGQSIQNVETAIEWDDPTTADNKVARLIKAANMGAPHRQVTNMKYNPNGLLTDHYLQDDESNHHTHLEYRDSEGTQIADWGVDDGKRFVSDLTDVHTPRTYSSEGCADCFQHFERDARGNVISRSDGMGNTAHTTYDASNHFVIDSETDESGDRTTYSDYDANGLPQTKVDARGNGGEPAAQHTWRYAFDGAGNVTGVTDPRGVVRGATPNVASAPFTTTLSYDQLDRMRVQHIPKDSLQGDYVTKHANYDVNDNVTSKVDGEGNATTYAYTPMDRVEQSSSPPARHIDENGDLTALAEPEVTKYTYDANGNTTSVQSPNGSRTLDPRNSSTRFVYDTANLKIGQIRRSHDATASPAEEDLLTSYTYDFRGNLMGVADARHNSGFASSPGQYDTDVANWPTADKLRFRYVYNAADKRTDSFEDPSGLNLHKHSDFDANGNLTGVTDERDNTTTYEYDVADRLKDTTDPENNREHRDLFPDGKLRTLTKPNGMATTAAGDFEVKYTYYPTGEVKTVQLPRAADQYGPVQQVKYFAGGEGRDPVGNPANITDPRGNHVTSTFFDTGELKTTDRPSWWDYKSDKTSGSVVEGKLAGIGVPSSPDEASDAGGSEGGGDSPGDGKTGSASQDAVKGDSPDAQTTGSTGEPDTTPPSDFGSVQPRPLPDLIPRRGLTTFDYDDEMRLKSVADTASHAATLERDPLGRVTETTRPFKPGDPIVTKQGYDYNGNVKQTTNGIGDSTTFDFDQFDRQILKKAPASSTDPTDAELTKTHYDENGNVTSVETPRGTTFNREYDLVDRVRLDANPLGETRTYAYDEADNKIAERSPRGNVNGCHMDGRTPACDSLTGPPDTCTDRDRKDPSPSCFTTRNTYDDANRLTDVTDPSGQTVHYTYDADDNKTVVDAPGSVGAPDQAPKRQLTRQTFDGRDLAWAKTTGSGADERTSVTEYDGNGNLRRDVNPAGVDEATHLPAHADTIQQVTDRTSSSDQTNAAIRNASKNATVNEYGADNLLTGKHLAWSDSDSGSHFEGDDDSPTSQDERRFRIDYARDSLGRTSAVTAPYEWTTDAAPSDANSFTYYANGWPETSTDAFDETVSYDYDAAGDQTKWWSGSESNPTREITRTFFPSGTLESRTASGSGSDSHYTYAYNANRALKRIVSSSPSRTMTIDRDDAERETRVTHSDDDSGTDGSFEHDTLFAWDANGNLSDRRTGGSGGSIEDYAGDRGTFEFDANDREIRAIVGGAHGGSHTYVSSYYESGQRSKLEKYNGTFHEDDPSGDLRVRTKLFYGDDGRMAQKIRGSDEPVLYEYNENGNRTKDDRGSSTFNARSQVTSWLAKETEDKPDPKRINYKVEGDGAIKEKKQDKTTTVNTLVGGRIENSKTTIEPSAGQTGSSTRKDAYCYGEFGKLESVRKVDEFGPDNCDGSPDGADDTRYDYDALDRLIRAKTPPPSGTQQNDRTFTYAYDGLDRREVRCKGADLALPSGGALDCGGTRTELDYIGTSKKLVAEHGDKDRRYDYDSKGELLGYQQDEDKYRSYEKDPQGTVIGLEQDSGAIAKEDRYVYDPYGELQPKKDVPTTPPNPLLPPVPDPNSEPDTAAAGYSQDARDNPLRFQGFYYDSGVKLYDMQARSYRPQAGQFLTADRFESSSEDFNLQADPLTQNRYALGGGNPIDNIEFDGHEPISSFTNPCDNTYGTAYACGRRGTFWQQRRSTQRQKTYTFAVSNNWRAGRRSSPKADRKQANQLANQMNARNANPRSDLQAGRPGYRTRPVQPPRAGPMATPGQMPRCVGGVSGTGCPIALKPGEQSPFPPHDDISPWESAQMALNVVSLFGGPEAGAAVKGAEAGVPKVVNLLKGLLGGTKASRGAEGAERTVVIGRDMSGRVVPYAERNGFDYYRGTPRAVPFRIQRLDLWFNRRWIQREMRGGSRVVDIGEQAGMPPSNFYKMEQAETAGYSKYYSDPQP